MTKILTYSQTTDFDFIGFRVVLFTSNGEMLYSLIEEKKKNGVVVADIRRHLDFETFQSLRLAVNSPV
jgi:hypothetical protein